MKNKICGIFGLAAFVIALALPARAVTNEELAGLAASNGFYRASVLTTSGYTGSEVLTDFPVLVRIKPGSPSGFAYSDMMFPDTGKDLGFVDMEGNGLPFEIDTWRGANDESLVWVTLPAVSNATQFAMVYRSSKSGKTLSAGNPFATYTGVWHLNESGSGAGNTEIADSSGKNLVGYAQGIAQSVSAGKLGGSWRMNTAYARNNTGVVVDLADSTKLNTFNTLGDTFHVSLWICPHGAIKSGDGLCWNVLIGHKETSATPTWGLSFNQDPNTMRIYNYANDGNKYVSSGNIVQKGFKKDIWGKLDVVYYTSGTTGKYDLYFNGTNVNQNVNLLDGKPAAQGSSNLGIGCFSSTAVERAFWGEVDEVRFLAGKTSGDRIRADYDTVAKASFLAAAQVVSFQEPPKPVFGHEVADVGAAFVQFSGSISVLGGEGPGAATSCEVLAKAWPTADPEPDAWTTIATGLAAGDSFSGTITGLSPLTGYAYKIKAVNNLPYESDVESDAFTTSGVGDAGTGGTVERQLDEFVHTFVIAPDGTATFSFTPPADVNEVDALIVGGGGPGGYYAGGGGGGGGLIYTNAMRVTGGATYTVTVGAGGEHATSVAAYGTNGGDSSIVGTDVSVTAVGGGAGGNGKQNNQTATLAGAAGGSGGGATWKDSSGGAGTAGQGNAGGSVQKGQSEASVQNHAGGGGGAAKPGGNAVGVTGAQSSGSGGDGLQVAISGVPVYYAGGGGGGGNQSNLNGGWGSAGNGGAGGGGRGGQYAGDDASAEAAPGTDNLGGGGGGGSTYDAHYLGGDGGNGIVIIRYGAGGDGQGATAPTVSLTGLDYDSGTSKATLDYRVAWAGSGYQTARVSAIWGYSEDALLTTNELDTSIIGAGSGEIELPSVSRTVYVRVVAENGGGAAGVSPEILSVVLFNPRAPEATASLSSVVCTNAVFAVDVTSLGQGAANATVSIQVAQNLAFTGDVLSFPDQTTVTATGAAAASAWGLALGATYYARAVVSNNIEQVYETDAIRFTTLVPGPPHGTAANADPGYTTVSANATMTDFGVGSGNAWMRLEVSTAADFATVDSVTPWLDATVDQQETLTAANLIPDTAYHVRVCLSNWWNLVTYEPLVDTATRAEPFAASGLSFAAGTGDTVDFSFPVTALYDGATVSATLTYAGAEIGTKSADAPATLSWTGVASAAETATATVVATATLPGGETVSKTWTVSVMPGASASIVSDVAAHASAEGALWMRPGEVVLLPPVAGSGFYQSLNERFATVEENTLTALEPGIVGIRCVDANAVTNVMGVVILPDAIGSGSIYVFKESKRKNTDDWARSECWDKVVNGARAATNDSIPQNVDDIAILPFYTAAGNIYVRHRSDLSLGGIYAGMIRPDTWVRCVLERYKDDTTKTVTFGRSDGEPVEVKVCPSSEGNCFSTIRLGGYDIDVVWAGDAVIDGCSSETDVNGPRGFFEVNSATSTNTLSGVKLRIKGLPGSSTSSASGSSASGQADNNGVALRGVWKGTGEIIKTGPGCISFADDFSGFSGVVREMSGPNPGTIGAPAAGVLMRAAGASNVTAHVYGYGSYNHSNGAMSYNGLSVGTLGTGGASVGPAGGAQGPAKGLHMHGGTYRANNIDNTSWGIGVKDEKTFDILSVGAGFNYITLVNGAGNGSKKPINAVTAKTLAQTDKGTLVVYDPSLNNKANQSVTNAMVTVENWADLATGGSGYGELDAAGVSDDFTIIPWMVANGDDKFSYLVFPAVDANGRLVRPYRKTTYISTATGEDANAVCPNNYGTLTRGNATEIVVNSLFLNNASNGDQWLGTNRTLTIKSGGLILHDNGSAIGLPGRDDNGKLVLGDASHPAYVWNKAFGNYTNRIWSAVTAAGGFVSTYTGNLELGGDQTGIAGEIVVNGGTLALGSVDYGITLADNLPVRVCAGAKLILPSGNAVAKNPLKIDGSGGAFGKVELPVNQTCASLAVRDVFVSDEWATLPSGTYGSSESAAEFVRDDLFVGPGVLTVGEAKARGVMFLIY